MNNSKEGDFFLHRGVVKSCENTIETRFEALIMSRKEKPFEWYLPCEERGTHELRVIDYNNENNASMDIQDIITFPLLI